MPKNVKEWHSRNATGVKDSFTHIENTILDFCSPLIRIKYNSVSQNGPAFTAWDGCFTQFAYGANFVCHANQIVSKVDLRRGIAGKAGGGIAGQPVPRAQVHLPGANAHGTGTPGEQVRRQKQTTNLGANYRIIFMVKSMSKLSVRGFRKGENGNSRDLLALRQIEMTIIKIFRIAGQLIPIKPPHFSHIRL